MLFVLLNGVCIVVMKYNSSIIFYFNFFIIMGLFFINYELWNRINELSLYLSTNQKMKSEIKIEFAFITNVKYCIKVYQLLWRENRIKSEMEIKLRPRSSFNLWLHGHIRTGFWRMDKVVKYIG